MTTMGNEEGEDKNEDEEKKKQPRLSWEDSLAVFVAAVESLLLPVIILAVILFIVAILLFVFFPGR